MRASHLDGREMVMPKSQRYRWYYPWLPITAGAVIVAGIVTLMLLGPPGSRAHGAPPKLEATAGFQTTDHLTLTVALSGSSPVAPRGKLAVELLDAEGKVLAHDTQEVQPADEPSSHRFQFDALKVPTDKITVRCRFGDQKPVEAPLAKLLLVKAHETALSTGEEFIAGTRAVMRCEVHGVKSLTETIPLPGATVAVRLRGEDGKTHEVYEGKAGAEAVDFQVPAVPAGKYKMEVVTKSTLGEEKLERDVQIKTAPKVLLVTDKPLYQPGQKIHLRALALNSQNLAPVAGKELTLEIEDGKSNKVFKKSVQTSEFGIASADFDLADEVNTGEYRIRALLGNQETTKTVTVKPYVLPKFKAEITADKKFYMPKEMIHADLQADYFFGKPIAKGKLEVTASTFDVAFKDFQTIKGETDTAGHAKFEIKLPDYFVGQPLNKGNALVKLEVKVTDTADHTETFTKTYPVSAQPIQVSLIPEGGRLTPGLENRIFVAAIYPDGSPAKCDVKVWLGRALNGTLAAELKTNEAGLAEFKLTPEAKQFRGDQWASRTIEMIGGNNPQVWGQKQLFDLSAEARDARGEVAKIHTSLTSEPFGENVLLRLDRAIYKGGDRMQVDIRTSAGLPTVYLDVIKGGQTMLTQWLDVKDGRAVQKVDLPQSVFGTLEVHAYQILRSGEVIRDSRVVYVNPPSDLKIDIKADRDVYNPGAEGAIRFQVTDAAGKPAPAALGLLIVDEAVYALQEMQPGLEKVFFTLQEELLKPQVEVLYKPATPINTLIREPILADAQQQAAEVLLTAVRPKPPARWQIDPVRDRREKVEEKAAMIGTVLRQYAAGHPAALEKVGEGKWKFKAGLLDEMVKAKMLDAAVLTDPVGSKLTLEALAEVEKGFTADRLGAALKMPDTGMPWWLPEDAQKLHRENPLAWREQNLNALRMKGDMGGRWGAFPGGGRGLGGGFPPPPGLPIPARHAGGPVPDFAPVAAGKPHAAPTDNAPAGGEPNAGPAPRLREFFPETLLWQPALITDDNGVGKLPITFADSITTWRLTASASSKAGALGGATAPLRVFQDFFVDIDLPVALTQNDEVAFPVAVYNYLKEPQTVKLDLKAEGWFALLDSQGLSRSLDLKPNEVTSIKYRIKAKGVGKFPLTVTARGSKMSDMVKRSIDVVPDGKKFEQVATDRLTGKVTQQITIPENAIPDASRLFVKVYPGVMSQILEGAEGLIRLPGG
jgi:hypothetical protein